MIIPKSSSSMNTQGQLLILMNIALSTDRSWPFTVKTFLILFSIHVLTSMLFVRIFGDLAVHLGQIHIDTWSTYGSRKRIRKDADPGIAEIDDARERVAIKDKREGVGSPHESFSRR